MSKKTLLMFITVGIGSFVVAIGSFIYAWLTFQKPSSEINATTTGVTFTFDIASTTHTSNYEYDVTNLSFFDVTNPDELDDFFSMVCEITVRVVNTSKDPVSYVIQQSIPASLSGRYLYCYFRSSRLTTTIIDNLTDVSGDGIIAIDDLLPRDPETNHVVASSLNGSLTEYSSNEGVTTDEATFYAYLFGIHDETDAADNNSNEFLLDSYAFAISIKCTHSNDISFVYDPRDKGGLAHA